MSTDRQHRFAGRRELRQTLADPHEDLDAEFVLEFADLSADAGLGRVQHTRHLGQAEARARRLAHGAQLLEVHGCSACRRQVRDDCSGSGRLAGG